MVGDSYIVKGSLYQTSEVVQRGSSGPDGVLNVGSSSSTSTSWSCLVTVRRGICTAVVLTDGRTLPPASNRHFDIRLMHRVQGTARREY